MGRVEGKVAFVTGAARNQGRSHAVRLAEEGADIIAVDVCASLPGVPYAGATEADLQQTAKEITARGRRVVARVADVRDLGALQAAVAAGVAELGRLDVVSADAGVCISGPAAQDFAEEDWDVMVDTNLKGVGLTTKAAIPTLIEQGTGGSIILTSSTAGLKGMTSLIPYVASKHGVVGLSRGLALELAPYGIRVNTVHPTSVRTPMIQHEELYHLFRPDLEHPTDDDVRPVFASLNALPVPWVEPVEISNAVLWLASDESRFVTGTELKVDAGSTTT